MADSPGKLIESTTILNLNDPCAIEDTSWIKPGKAAWDWWSGPVAPGKHFDVGTNNETVKYFVDFAAEMHLQYMVVDEGWYADKDSRKRKDYDYDLTKTVPEIDLPMLIKYAKQRKVGLVLWMHWVPVSKQMDRVFPYLHKLGIKGVKVDFMDHDDQQMVEFYHRVVKCAAKNHLLIDLHGAYKPTGLMRTYPNFVTQEGVMGAEYNKWSMRITPSYNLTLPFTRMAVGPMDYTPGGFRNVTVEQFEKHSTAPLVMSTRAQELAKFVVFLSPLQMVADYPGAYENEQGTEFIKAVPSNWDETRVLAGEIGKYIVVARRKGDTWYLGAMTNESPAKLSVELDFLGNGNYTLSGFKDGPNAAKNATDVLKVSMPVNSSTKLELNLAPAGGFAAALTPR
jgi:alpha-glucosidase